VQSLDPKFRAFLESAPDAIVVVDKSGQIVAVNRLTEAMFGYPQAQLVGSPIELLVPERLRGSHDRQRQAYTRAPRTRQMGAGQDLRGRRRNGDEFVVQITLSPIDTESGPLVISIIRDVTEQREDETKFRGLLESAPDGIVVVDSEGKIVIVNSQTEKMFGYSRDELLNQKIEILVPQRFHGTHVADRTNYGTTPQTRPMGAGRALTGRKKDGTEFPVEISLSPLRTEHGMLVMSIVRDITDRRRAEELIQASLREKEALLREIHHRVKNNLQITSSLLRLQASSIDDEKTREVFAGTQLRIRSMALVHEKLYQSTNLSEINFPEYLRTLADLLFQSFGTDPSKVEFTIEGDEVLLPVDIAVPCGLIVNELLSNALKHAFPDGKGTIVVGLTATDGSCAISVRDNGVGLPPNVEGQGSTLGLQLVRALVQQIEGTMDIDRSAGTQFRITFRLARGAHA
jgi:PAS domain S-box-containing protein